MVWGGIQRRELKGRVRICHLAASDTDVRTDKWTTETKQKGVTHIYELNKRWYKSGVGLGGNGWFIEDTQKTTSLYGVKQKPHPSLTPYIKVNSRVRERVHPLNVQT